MILKPYNFYFLKDSNTLLYVVPSAIRNIRLIDIERGNVYGVMDMESNIINDNLVEIGSVNIEVNLSQRQEVSVTVSDD